MDISEITRKQSKNEQARTRESEEYKKKPKIQSRSQKSQASVKSKAHKGVGFALDPLTKEAQAVTSRNDSLAILECTHLIQRLLFSSQSLKKLMDRIYWSVQRLRRPRIFRKGHTSHTHTHDLLERAEAKKT
ncbi:hypothetical protein Tco_1225388, partial [Tanacetum coccineum]